MVKRAFICAHCGGPGERETGDYNRKVAQGLALYCSRPCAYEAFRKRGRNIREARLRPCATCGTMFIPRPVQLAKGGGRYCSQKCNKALHEAGQRPEVWAARIETIREKRARGEWTVLSGEANPRWMGGKEAATRRLIESGRRAEQVKRYRAKNPDKVREFTRRRKERKLGRLPRGTISRIRALQRNRCAICRVSLRNGDHVDHIIPLARGGTHTSGNIQLLCPTCNVRKSDRDPIQHMQSLGRLL